MKPVVQKIFITVELPEFAMLSTAAKFRDYLDRKANTLPVMPDREKIIVHNPKIMGGKSDMTIRLRHSERQRIPSRRLDFPNIYPVIRVQKKPTKAS